MRTSAGFFHLRESAGKKTKKSSQEIEGIKNVWNVPMAGMFSNAELGRATGSDLEMHNETTCIVALKEK